MDVLNLMPIYPNADTPFAGVPEPSPQQMARLREEAEPLLPQMRHCTRCRADAVGLLDEDRTEAWRGCLDACAQAGGWSSPTWLQKDRFLRRR